MNDSKLNYDENDIEQYTTIDGVEEFPNSVCNSLLPYNVYLYWYDDNLRGSDYANTIPFSHASTLISAKYAPYFNESDFRLVKFPYDKERFGYDGAVSNIYVYRINRLENLNVNYRGSIEKTLGTITPYAPVKSIGGKRNWRNESRLYNYPYSYGYLADGISTPIEIKYENCPRELNPTVKVRQSLSISADYNLFIVNYKNDGIGEIENFGANPSPDLPISSSQYAQWLATNKNQRQASKDAMTTSMLTRATQGAVTGALGGSIIPGAGTVVGGTVGFFTGLMSSGITKLEHNKELLAQQQDNRNLPNTLLSGGSDLVIGKDSTRNRLMCYHYRQKDDVMERIGDFFAMFGYAQNKIMRPNIRNRYYYNYLKTSGVNMKTFGIPREHVTLLKGMIDRGITMWHVDRKNVNVGDYSNDNYEV